MSKFCRRAVASAGVVFILLIAPSTALCDEPAAGPRLAVAAQLPHIDAGRTAFNSDDTLLALPQGGDVTVRRVDTWAIVTRLTAPGFLPWQAVFSPDGKTIASINASGADAQLRVWNLETGQELYKKAFPGLLGNVAFSPDGGRLLVLGRAEEVAHILSAASGEELFAAPFALVRSGTPIDFSADGRWVCTRVDGDAIVWDAASGAKRCRCEPLVPNDQGQFGGLGEPRLNRDGTLVAATGQALDGHLVVIVYDAINGRPLRTLQVRGYQINTLTFSPDGRRIAAGLHDERQAAPKGPTVTIWEAATGELIRTFESSGDGALPSFSPDGSRIRTPGWTRPNGEIVHRIYCWEIETGREVGDGKLDGRYSRSGRFLLNWIAGRYSLLDGRTGEVIREID